VAVMHSYYCKACGAFERDRWSDDVPSCCGSEMDIAFLPAAHKNTDEWGGPRHYPHLREEPFGSRGELARFARENNLALGASSDKHHGARNESHLGLGRIYSFGK